MRNESFSRIIFNDDFQIFSQLFFGGETFFDSFGAEATRWSENGLVVKLGKCVGRKLS